MEENLFLKSVLEEKLVKKEAVRRYALSGGERKGVTPVRRKLLAATAGLCLLIVLAFALPTVLGGPGESDGIFYNEEFLVEGSNTTYVTPGADGTTLASKYLIEERDLLQQARESTIIVKGQVVKILDTLETKDLELPQGRRLHTDVLFRVDQYLGPYSLPYEYLVLRRMGGKIEGFTHVVNQENLTVGEELIIFRLSRPEYISQVPDGYSLDQYFVFNPASKFTSIGGDRYRASYMNKVYRMKKILQVAIEAKPQKKIYCQSLPLNKDSRG